ncbi:class I SAM-dependent methyltransferase [Aquiflexum sp. LQ15W]|uniref:class I SAM-dependent methyltransferase n=1 Tax=Cognataquiflexum nitidum TaxID=2922272 RepID=UPI001F1379E2|nr:class I SAM-dependent methyltransferase [Cognataquiflexum nitidum]MCH6201724.1 class I SAM-dependent methyltransferase [Cognataquiflexum nitidum]
MMKVEKHKWNFPLSVPKKGIKKGIKLFIGKAALLLQPPLREKLLSGMHPKNRIERLALATLVFNLGKKGSQDELAQLHRKLWENPEAFQFYDWSDKRFDSWFGTVKEKIDRIYQQFFEIGIKNRIVEIGCGSGKILKHLHENHNFEKLIGLDINQSLIEFNKSGFQEYPRLEFEAGDAVTWIAQNHKSNTVYMTFGGVLEYFTENELLALFQSIKKGSPSAILFFEPLAENFDPNLEPGSRIFGSELSFSHPYTKFAKENGMEIINSEIMEIGSFRFLLLGAYFR